MDGLYQRDIDIDAKRLPANVRQTRDDRRVAGVPFVKRHLPRA